MKSTGLPPCFRTMSESFLAYSANWPLSVGWIGHWLQSIITATSNSLSFLLNTTLFSESKENAPTALGRKYDSTSCHCRLEPLIVASVERSFFGFSLEALSRDT